MIFIDDALVKTLLKNVERKAKVSYTQAPATATGQTNNKKTLQNCIPVVSSKTAMPSFNNFFTDSSFIFLTCISIVELVSRNDTNLIHQAGWRRNRVRGGMPYFLEHFCLRIGVPSETAQPLTDPSLNYLVCIFFKTLYKHYIYHVGEYNDSGA